MGKKKLLAIFLFASLFLITWTTIAGANSITLEMPGKKYTNVSFTVEGGELLVPARLVVEEFGGKLEWYELLKVMIIKFDDGQELKLQVGSTAVQINPGQQVKQLSVPPRQISGQVMVPLRFFAGHFGFLSRWDDKNKYAKVYKPANWVMGVSLEEGINGESVVIDSTKKVTYSTMILSNPDRLVIDLADSALSAKAANLCGDSYAYKQVKFAQFNPETVRVVIELNNQIQYKIVEESGKGHKIKVVFTTGVRQIALTERGISIKASGEIGQYKVMEFSEPERLVIDLPDQTLQLKQNTIPIDHPDVKQIRVSQLSWEPKVVRLVLDLNEKIEYNILRGNTADEIIVQLKGKKDPVAKTPAPAVKPGNDTKSDNNQKKPGENTEIVLVQVGREYSDNEIVSIGIVEGLNQQVVIRTSTPVTYKAWHLPNPDRLIVDLDGAITKLTADQIPAGKGNIKGVRVHQYPDKVRVVFDLVKFDNYKVFSDRRTQHISIGLGVNPLTGKVIVLDPGHGGSDPGAIGPSGVFEKDITLDIALKLAVLLKNAGATVVLTRDKDVYPTLGERVDLANQLDADTFVSIHCNSLLKVDPGGTETFVAPKSQALSTKLAKAIQSSVVKTLKLYDRGVKSNEFYVLNHTTMPAALVEVAFISKKDEEAMLTDAAFRDKAARSIYDGIVDYYNENFGK